MRMLTYVFIFQSPEPDDEEEEEDNDAVQAECLEAFASRDYIMEPGVFNMLKRSVFHMLLTLIPLYTI